MLTEQYGKDWNKIAEIMHVSAEVCDKAVQKGINNIRQWRVRFYNDVQLPSGCGTMFGWISFVFGTINTIKIEFHGNWYYL